MEGRRERFCSRRLVWFHSISLCAVGLISLAIWAPAALATTTNYWGYGNLTASNPTAGTCPNSVAGIACSGWAEWDYSQVGWNSGRSAFGFGFICQSDGYLWGPLMNGSESFGTYTALWSDWCPGHYNKAAVTHLSGGAGTYNYLQGRALIF